MSSLLRCALLNTPVGLLRIFADDFALRRIAFPGEGSLPAADEAEHPLLRQAAAQITEYFAGQRQTFDLPLSPPGSVFQQTAWEAMRRIPYGATKTYGEIAAELGDRNKARAVGHAAGRNPLPLVIPCHRVLGCSGKLTGFSAGLAVKQLLLDLERGSFRSGRNSN